VSLPNARSTEQPIERDSSSREGRLADTSVPELLARAYRVSFTGSLLLEPAHDAASSLKLVEGAVVHAGGPWKSHEAEWDVLGQFLPPDTLAFATRHAAEYGVEPFDAVERLVLLPGDSLASARQALTVHGVREVCGLSGDVRYAFVAPLDSDAAGDPALRVEPLGLLTACFLADSQRERAAKSVAAFEHAPLSIDRTRARSVIPTLNGPVRAVLEGLVLSSGSVHLLREKKLVPDAEFVASVCALFITREVRLPSPAVTIASSARTTDPPSVPPFSPAASSMLPPRRESGFVRAVRMDEDMGAKEHAMEQKVEEAWLRAEADPSRAQQISAIVLKAVSVFPKNARLRYYLARLHVQANRLDEAAAELERVLELDPTDAQAESELASLRERRSGDAH